MGQTRCNNVLLQAIAAKLRQLRKERKLSQIDVYIDTDIHIGRIEQGKTNITVTTLSDICDYYKISLEDFSTASKMQKRKYKLRMHFRNRSVSRADELSAQRS